jgi:tetratricopeptide (TPR) repeat protein
LASEAPVRQFVDREEFIAPVETALKEPPRTKPLVLVYYGGAGLGKSRLRRELTKQLAADPGVLTATLDFAIPLYRQPDTALFFLRKTIHEAYQVKFPSFDLAYAVCWQKTHPDTAIAVSGSPNAKTRMTNDVSDLMLEPGSLLSQLLDESGKLPLIGLVPRISSLLARSPEPQDPGTPEPALRAWWERRGERELEDLPQMELKAIVERLPMLWAADLRDYLRAGSRESRVENGEARSESPLSTPHSRRAVLFIDSYEKLWETGDRKQETGDSRQETDEWVRELVKQLPEALWIVCGRQKLRWKEVEADWDNALSQHQLGALPDNSARRFLTSCGITSEPIQDAIVKGSQGVPHYLDLAVDTVERTRDEGQRTELTADSPDELVKQFVRHLDQPEIETLQVLSGPRFWYYGLFENLMAEYQTGYPLTAYDDLSRFSFVKEGAAPGTRTMHELMREALQESQTPELRKRVHLFLHEHYARQIEGLNVKGITEKHRAALTEAFYHGRQAKSAEELWPWFGASTSVFADAGQYRLLIPLYREMVQALETELGPNHPGVAEALFGLGKQLGEQGEYDETEPLYRRALKITEEEYGPVHSRVLDCLSSLAELLRKRARYDEAELLCRRVVGARDKSSVSPVDQAEALDNLAAVLTDERKFPEAEELFRQALAICEKELGPEHRKTSTKLNNLASLLWQQERYAEAEPLYRRALGIDEKALGTNHPDLMFPLDGLGLTLHTLGRYAEAEPLHRRSLKLCEENLGPDHPDTAIAMNNLSCLLREQRRFAEAEPLARRALAVYEKRMGPDHPHTIGMANNLITVLLGQGKYAEAEPMVMSTIATREKKLGPDHPQTARALAAAGAVCRAQGRYADAEGFLRRALDIRTRVLGPENSQTLDSLRALGVLEEQRGRYAEAESLYRDSLEKRERVQGQEHPDVASTANLLAGICSRDGRYSEAEALYRRALAIREKVFGPDHTFVAEPLEGLAKVCEQTGRTSEAQELSDRAKRIRAQAAPAPTNPK